MYNMGVVEHQYVAVVEINLRASLGGNQIIYGSKFLCKSNTKTDTKFQTKI